MLVCSVLSSEITMSLNNTLNADDPLPLERRFIGITITTTRQRIAVATQMVVNLLTRCDENSAAFNKMGAGGQTIETENRRVKGEIFSLVATRWEGNAHV